MFLYLRTMSGGGLQPMDAEHALQQTQPPDWMLGVPKTSDLTQAAFSRKPLGVLLALLIMLMAGMVVSGFALSVQGFSSIRRSSSWQSSAAPPLRWSFGELARITFLAVAIALLLPFVQIALLAAMPSWKLDVNVWIPVSMLVLDLFVIIAVLAFAVNKPPSRWALLTHSGRRLSDSVKTGLRSYVTVFPWLILLLVLISWVARAIGFQPPLEPIHRLLFLEDRAGVLVLTALLACVIGPIAEEFFFRGVVYGAIRSRTSRLVAMLISGGLFAVTHTNLMGFLPIGVLGCLLAYLYERTGTLIASITVHVFHNSLLLAFAMIFRHFTPSG
ncbi:MAG: type II CAAX endopeptidase family protein, partial [Candidatus Omnitrophota bacterium]|nr:type II CAAX endopeptidase family protein [Candidatus Omnitrophota bacterium]